MGQEDRIQNAYRGLGGNRTFYDGMITCSTLSGRAVCRLVWGMGRAESQDYLSAALAGIPEGFSGRLLEVLVVTGILTMPLYRQMLEETFGSAKVRTVQSMASFVCRKAKEKHP